MLQLYPLSTLKLQSLYSPFDLAPLSPSCCLPDGCRAPSLHGLSHGISPCTHHLLVPIPLSVPRRQKLHNPRNILSKVLPDPNCVPLLLGTTKDRGIVFAHVYAISVLSLLKMTLVRPTLDGLFQNTFIFCKGVKQKNLENLSNKRL